MKKLRASSSGTSNKSHELPKLLKYPRLLPYESGKLVKDVFCYVLRHYGQDGFCVLVSRRLEDDSVAVMCGDFKGNVLDLYDKSDRSLLVVEFLNTEFQKILGMMSVVGIPQAQYFLELMKKDRFFKIFNCL